MGLAASQARYLALTARKTNVEYQGQQINQQRTHLANESAGIFNEMLALKVPTAPSVADYMDTNYSFEDLNKTYTFDPQKIYKNGDMYTIGLNYTVTGNVAYPTSATGYIDEIANAIYIKGSGNTYNSYALNEVTDNLPEGVTRETLSAVNSSYEDENSAIYQYTIDSINYYLSQQDYERMLENPTGSTYRPLYIGSGDVEKSGSVKAFLTEENSQYKTLQIAEDSVDIPELTQGLTFNLVSSQVEDTAGYEQAKLDYEYERDLYNKRIEEINAKTKELQIEDRTLELKLRQLDTEQEAIKTELDSVKEVIKNTCERVFKTFQSS